MKTDGTPDPPVRVPGGFLTLHGYLPAALLAYAERVIGTACELWADIADPDDESPQDGSACRP